MADGATVRTPAPPLDVLLAQPRRGYRFGPESLVLPGLIERTAGRVVDLGAGCGVLGLIAGAATRARAVTLVERQPELAALCEQNRGALEVNVEVVRDDLRTCALPTADLVVANPPFFAPGEGRASSNLVTRNATHAHAGDVFDFAAAAARAVSDDGTCWFVFPADRVATCVEALTAAELSVARLVWVYARHSGRPYRVWVAAGRTARPLQSRSVSVWTRR